MTQASLETLSAFADGDAVEPEALATALAQPGAHTAMIEIARLRAAVRRDTSVPSKRFYVAMEARIASSRRGRVLRVVAAAAVILGIGIAAGLALRSGGNDRVSKAPPEPTREIQFTPGVDWFSKS